jgi:hypothetical protein
MPMIVIFTRAGREPNKNKVRGHLQGKIGHPRFKEPLFKTFNGCSWLVNTLSVPINCMFLAAVLFIS